MKNKLGIFFAGIGTGVALAFLMIGLAPDRPRAQRHVSTPVIVYGDTNTADRWERVTRWCRTVTPEFP